LKNEDVEYGDSNLPGLLLGSAAQLS